MPQLKEERRQRAIDKEMASDRGFEKLECFLGKILKDARQSDVIALKLLYKLNCPFANATEADKNNEATETYRMLLREKSLSLVVNGKNEWHVEREEGREVQNLHVSPDTMTGWIGATSLLYGIKSIGLPKGRGGLSLRKIVKWYADSEHGLEKFRENYPDLANAYEKILSLLLHHWQYDPYTFRGNHRKRGKKKLNIYKNRKYGDLWTRFLEEGIKKNLESPLSQSNLWKGTCEALLLDRPEINDHCLKAHQHYKELSPGIPEMDRVRFLKDYYREVTEAIERRSNHIERILLR